MLFNSFEFLLFLTGVFILAPFLRGRRRHALLLVASYLFYASWNPLFVLLLMFSTLLDYVCGGRVAAAATKRVKRAYVATSLIGNLGVLVYFKYGDFFLENIAFIAGVDASPFYLDLIIPLGISFYTFQSMSYTIDMYRGSAMPRDLVAAPLRTTTSSWLH